MGRRALEPTYYPTKSGYFTVVRGRRVPLAYGPKDDPATKKLAWQRFREEHAASLTQVDGDHQTLGTTLNAWYADCVNRRLTQNTLDNYHKFLSPFIAAFGRVKVVDLRPRQIREFLATMRQDREHPANGKMVCWNDSSIRQAIGVYATAFNWAVDEELISRSPMKKKGGGAIKRPIIQYGQGHAAITEAEHESLLHQTGRRSKKSFHKLLQFWWATGCRPGEMALARTDEWSEQRQALVIRATDPRNIGRFKLARLKRDRIVYVPSNLVSLMRELVKAAGADGLLFKNEAGAAYTSPIIDTRFRSLRTYINRRRPGTIRPEVSAYSYRHAFVTRWLVAGRSAEKLCELLNTSVKMLKLHYSHLFEEHQVLRDELDGFTQSPQSKPEKPSAV